MSLLGVLGSGQQGCQQEQQVAEGEDAQLLLKGRDRVTAA